MADQMNYQFAFRMSAIALAVGALAFAACSGTDGEPSNFGTSGSGGSGGSSGNGNGGSGATVGDGGPIFDTGWTGDGEIDPDSSCADLKLEAQLVPLDMYFMVDTSGSMSTDDKIVALRNGLSNFFKDPQSAGLGAGAQEFPIAKNNDKYNETCDANVYAKPGVEWAVLPNPALVSWIEGRKSGGYTPTSPALNGAVQACRDRLSVEPTHKCSVVMVTDGVPEGNCPPLGSAAETPLGNVAAAAFAEGIPVFTIGFPGLDSVGQAVITTVAQKGGTTAPIIIQSGNVGQSFINALNDIRGSALGCEYQMPTAEAGTVNPNLVKVTYTPGGSTQGQELPRVDDVTKCGSSGWYYDDNTTPTKLIMCPDTCEMMQNDSEGQISILLGCTGNQR